MRTQEKGKRTFVPATPDFRQRKIRKRRGHSPVQLVVLVIMILILLIFVVWG